MTQLTPREIVSELDRYIVGQQEAKRSVAIALRNRWRRKQVDEKIRHEIYPKNILMIGPTGVGKTEIARRLAKLAKAPFIKVEATKYTEVGYVGKEVDSIIRELTEVGMKMVKESYIKKNMLKAQEIAEERVLDALVPLANNISEEEKSSNSTRQIFRKKIREGQLDDKEIEIRVADKSTQFNIIGANAAIEEVNNQIQSLFDNLNKGKTVVKKMKVKDALNEISIEEAEKFVNVEDMKSEVINLVENSGIVFIDEIDKICGKDTTGSRGEVSRQGVQRDLLPLIEGCQVNTKYGMVKTDHILFITSGAFSMAKPSDLIPELQGRLPIRVELKALSAQDFIKILTEPHASLTKQYQALLATEGISLKFTDEAIEKIAQDAFKVNEKTENIGARRLHTLMEKLLEDLSFEASENSGKEFVIDLKYVDDHLADLVEDEDISRYIL